MSKFGDLLGTLRTTFQIGLGGSGLRRLRFRNHSNGNLEWNPSTDRTITLPDASGTVFLTEQAIATSSGEGDEGRIPLTNATGYLGIAVGGTGAGNAATARSNLGFPGSLTGMAHRIPIVNLAGTAIALSPDLTLTPGGALQSIGVGVGAVAGNARGVGAVDLQVNRNAAMQVASGHYSVVAGWANAASGVFAVAIGEQNNAAGQAAVALGRGCGALGMASTALGSHSTAGRFGEVALAGGAFINGLGNGQSCTLNRMAVSTNATPIDIVFANYDLTNTEPIVLQPNSLLFFEIRVAGLRTDAFGEIGIYRFHGGIRRGATAASTTMVGLSLVYSSESVASWNANISANTTNGSLQITGTGEASKTIRWVATVEFTEILA